jgi:hypothetical protein
MKRIHLGKLFIKVMLAILLLVNIVGYSNVNANHGSTIHNATEQNAGN